MLNKFISYFDPTKITMPIHIVGCGAIGSTLAVMLARCGLSNIHLWDFDTVEWNNIANQQYFHANLGQPKTECLKKQLMAINPRIKVHTKGKWTSESLAGAVCLCLDNIDTRRDVTKAQMQNNRVKLMLDFRMRLTDAQHFMADWVVPKEREIFLRTMNFSHEEAAANTPVSACNTTLSIMPTVQTIVSLGVSNMINYFNKQPTVRMVVADPFALTIDL